MREFDDDELFSTSDRDQVHAVLEELCPAAAAVPVIAQRGAELVVSYRTGVGTAFVAFSQCLVFRYGHPDTSRLHQHRLYEAGLQDLGIYYIGDSLALKAAHLSWVGQPVSTSNAWNLRHYAIVFNDGLLEFLGGFLSYDVFPTGPGPAELVAERLNSEQ